MTPIERTKAIADEAALRLPGLLSAASLDDFDVYHNKSLLRTEDNEFCVYIEADDNLTDSIVFVAYIQAQISGTDKDQEYHSVIMPFLEEFIDADLVEYDERDFIMSDPWPTDLNSRSLLYYKIGFSSPSDDCDF